MPLYIFNILYNLLYVRSKKDFNAESGWVSLLMRLQAFFVARTGIHIPILHEMCRKTLNAHIGTGTLNLNMQAVFILSLFHDVYCTSVLF